MSIARYKKHDLLTLQCQIEKGTLEKITVLQKHVFYHIHKVLVV